MRGLAIDSRTFERLVLSTAYYDSTATPSTPAYRGPSGALVQRLDRVGTVTDQGWGALIFGARPSGAPTVPIGSRVRLAWWARAHPAAHYSFRLALGNSTQTVTFTPVFPNPEVDEDWRHIVSPLMVTGSNAIGSMHKLLLTLAASVDAWLEVSDPLLIYS